LDTKKIIDYSYTVLGVVVFIMKKFFKYGLFLLPIALILAAVQELVIHGGPLKWNNNYIGEFSTTWIYLVIIFSLLTWLLKIREKVTSKNTFDTKTAFVGFFIYQIICFTLLIFTSVVLLILVKGSFEIRLKPGNELRFILIYTFFVNSLVYLIVIGYRLYLMYHNEKDAKHLAEKSFMEAQLNMLRQQLNPHFLFNNLNIIASTIKSNPSLAHDFTISMASFYRKVLETENAGWVSLRNELKTIQSYLYMLSIRFEDKLMYTINIEEKCLDTCLLPDFILQPIIENVIKHNSLSKLKPLHIKIWVDDQYLVVSNNLQPKENIQDSLGVGWFNIESRYKYLNAKMPLKFIKDNDYVVKVPLQKITK
jgi:sensor histidine kinase YesM